MFRVCKIVFVRQKTFAWLSAYGTALWLALALATGLVFAAAFPTDGLQSARHLMLGWPTQWLVIAPFFFLVGLELRREFQHGALTPLPNALSPALAAIIGVVLPALWFLVVTQGTEFQSGWPIPTATDVTFALAVYTAFGRLLPRGARTFLLAFAVIDDVIAVVLITCVFGFSADSGFAELLPAILGLALPVRWPARLERNLAVYLNVFGLPVFAFFMAATPLPALAGVTGSVVFWGVVARPAWKWLGVFLGGQIGQRWAVGDMKLQVAVLARVASLGGIGFTVSLLVAGIAFKSNQEAFSAALIATFIASIISALVSAAVLVRGHRS